MNDWDRFRRYSAHPKLPPPEHGIRVKRAGVTWWGQRWLEALERVLRGDAGRLSRGRGYARAGRVHDLTVSGGTVKANVTGTRAAPYEVVIELSELDDATWNGAIAALAERAKFSAELLARHMPSEIDTAFGAAGASLFPRDRKELVTRCSCPDAGDPCKHVAATHYVLGDALDRDPFLLFELRGRTEMRVLSELRRARSSASAATGTRGDPAAEQSEHVIPSVTLGAIEQGDYDAPRTALPDLSFSFDAPSTHAAVLRQLGAPAAWTAGESPAELLGHQVQTAADAARRIALAEVPSVAPASEPERALRRAPDQRKTAKKDAARRRNVTRRKDRR